MNQPNKFQFDPVQEGFVGVAMGTLLGFMLFLFNIISPPAILGVAAGVGIGSWLNARRRKNQDK